MDHLCGAEYWPAAVQELRIPARFGCRPAGCQSPDHHQRHALLPQPARSFLRVRFYHLCGKRRRQAQDQPGGRGGHAAGWHPGNHPCQLVCTQYREGLLHPPVEFFPKDGDGSMHLCRLGCRCAAHHSWRSALLLQQAQARQHRRKSQVLQQQRLSPKQKLRVVVF